MYIMQWCNNTKVLQWVLDLNDDDIYWCTADPGWVTGTAYGIFGPWLNGATSLILGGRFSPQAWYNAIQEYGVTVWYSAPTAFRMLAGAGDGLLEKYDLSSLTSCFIRWRAVKSRSNSLGDRRARISYS